MRKILYFLVLFPIYGIGQTDTMNYVKTLTYTQETQTSNESLANPSVTYFDGLGRPIQQVEGKASPLLKDIVTHIEYDQYGRTAKTYLPYTSTLSTMLYDSGAKVKTNTLYNQSLYENTTNPYTEQFYEPSPLNRVVKQGSPGALWLGATGYNNNADHTFKTSFQTNKSTDLVRRFQIVYNDENKLYEPKLTTTGYYLINQLYKTISKDENWTTGKANTTEEYTDKFGREILKRVWTKEGTTEKALDTYYVYDRWDKLIYVIPPLASDKIVLSSAFVAFPSVNHPWTHLAVVTSSLEDAYENAISSYDNSDILNAPLLSTYGGEGGFSITTNEQGGLALIINITTSTPQTYRTGKILDLDDIGNFQDKEIGRLSGSGYSYIFTVRDNAIFVTGSGKVPSTVQVLSGLQPLEYNRNYPWTNVCISDPAIATKYNSDIASIPNSQILDVYTTNSYGAKGGMNITIASDNTVTLTMNVTSTADMDLLKGKTFTLPIQRAIPNIDLGTVTGPGYNYGFQIVSNALIITGSGKSKNFSFYLSARPAVNYTIVSDAERMCYIYHYDELDHLVEKQVPDNGWIYTVFDASHKPVLTQDENQRKTGTWTFTKYTTYSRVAYRGFYQNTDTRVAVQQYIKQRIYNTSENRLYEYRTGSFASNGLTINYDNNDFPVTNVFEVNYYENYAPFASTMVPPSANSLGEIILSKPRRQLTGKQIKVLGSNIWTTTTLGYDKEGRTVWSQSKNDYLGTTDLNEKMYSFTDLVLRNVDKHTRATSPVTSVSTYDQYDYDQRGRLKTHVQGMAPVWSPTNAPSKLIASNYYDELGQLVEKRVGNTVAAPLQSMKYYYNIRGWLKGINNQASLTTNNLFGLTLDYSGLYNGNISHILWNSLTNQLQKKYDFTYDPLNRLISAVYSNAANSAEKYDEKGITYDKNGNILTLTRLGSTGTSTYGTIDQLSYIYKPNSNQLMRVNETNPSDTFGFINGLNTGDDYDYDFSGNMKKDLNKNIGTASGYEITYNHMNLPNSIIKDDTHRIDFIYDAGGTKLEKKVTNGAGNVETTQYAKGYVYKNNVLEYFPHEEGYVRRESNGSFTYIYQYKDHLGNVRITYGDLNANNSITASEIIEENDYYPFGMGHVRPGSVALSTNLGQKIKYQGQERQDELSLNWDSFKWRNYDYAIGRFISVDPLAEKFAYNGVYNFSENRIINSVELEGLECVSPPSPFERANRTENLKDKPFTSLISTLKNAFSNNPKEAKAGVQEMINNVPGYTGTKLAMEKFGQKKTTSESLTIAASALEMVSFAEVGSIIVGEGVSAARGAIMSSKEANSSTTVFRVFGGDASAAGYSWTPENPLGVPNFRNAAGLPSGGESGATNTAEKMIKGTVKNKNIIKVRAALPLDGNSGGLPEFIIDPKNVKVKSTTTLDNPL